ncbi:hypothetical protein B0J12DRAFT_741836 [Macrophomina phaseolina]|uniref:Protein HRI1 n=1 Tax=Macrophomina phaseolina TaxID=35725 RepID=A0ABQ8G5U8_9PEZI|nr:hypothetical protein B0J12DRAFT_741836 [Macrophomina phaseolina]
MVQTTTNSSSDAGDVSLRKWICWDGEAPTEPTSTLVLTSPSNTFIDIRLLLPTPHTPAAERPLPNTGGPLDRLDWAFAGVSESLPPIELPHAQQHASSFAPLAPIDVAALRTDGEGVASVPRKRWRHVIDSRCKYGEVPGADEGEMYPVQRGSKGAGEECLEMGRMERWKGSGVVWGYQELWVSLEAKPVVGDSLRRGVVLSLDMPEHKARGSVIRVGQFVQGLLMIDDEVTVERWEFCLGPQNRTVPEWRRIAKLGSRFLPCAWTFEDGQASVAARPVGSELVHGEMCWKLQERFEW